MPHSYRFISFLCQVNVQGLSLDGDESNAVASLLFADFPTGCLVQNISMDMVGCFLFGFGLNFK